MTSGGRKEDPFRTGSSGWTGEKNQISELKKQDQLLSEWWRRWVEKKRANPRWPHLIMWMICRCERLRRLTNQPGVQPKTWSIIKRVLHFATGPQKNQFSKWWRPSSIQAARDQRRAKPPHQIFGTFKIIKNSTTSVRDPTRCQFVPLHVCAPHPSNT